MEQNREPRNEHTFMGSHTIGGLLIYDKRRQQYTMGGAFSINGVEKTGQLHAKESNWTTLSHHAQK